MPEHHQHRSPGVQTQGNGGAAILDPVFNRFDLTCIRMPEFSRLALDAEARFHFLGLIAMVGHKVDIRIGAAPVDRYEKRVDMGPGVLEIGWRLGRLHDLGQRLAQ